MGCSISTRTRGSFTRACRSSHVRAATVVPQVGNASAGLQGWDSDAAKNDLNGPASQRASRCFAAEAAPAAPPTVAGVATRSTVKMLNIIHFNDVYNIEARSQEPVGGASKFVTKVRQLQETKNALVLFAGDAFSPSIMSTLTRGEQMPPVFNNIGVHVAAVGNHDLDFGAERMAELITRCDCQWLMANVLTPDTKQPFPGCLPYVILDWGGVKVGVVRFESSAVTLFDMQHAAVLGCGEQMGLVEHEWLATLASIELGDVTYIDFVEEGRRLEPLLRQAGCDVVVALTHMRAPNDQRLGREVPGIDIILGGHDHHYEVLSCPPESTLVFKSGTDFRELSLISLELSGSARPVVHHERVLITADIPDDPATSAIVDKYLNLVGERMEVGLGFTASPLDGRFAVVRTQESNLGNLLTDIARLATGGELVMINSGTLRSDSVHDGALKNKDLLSILPMMDEMCVLEITGGQVLAALENSVCMHPKMEGRFLQVSGLQFCFDPAAPAGKRVQRHTVVAAGQPLDASRKYTLVTKAYLAQGKDGFDVFKKCKVLQDAEDSSHLPTMVTNHFDAIARLNKPGRSYSDSCGSSGGPGCAYEAKLLGLAEAAAPDDNAVCRWSEAHQEYVVDPRVEGRIVAL